MIIFYPFWQLRGCTTKIGCQKFLKIPRTSSRASNACFLLELATKLCAARQGGRCHHQPLPRLTPAQRRALPWGPGSRWQGSDGAKPKLCPCSGPAGTAPTSPHTHPCAGSPLEVTSTPPCSVPGWNLSRRRDLVGPAMVRGSNQHGGWSGEGRKGVKRMRVTNELAGGSITDTRSRDGQQREKHGGAGAGEMSAS